MPAKTHTMTFDGPLTQRGFWLYVWTITSEKGEAFLYVGRTGDESSVNASSPFARIGQHLGIKKGNSIREHLNIKRVKPETCTEFKMIAYGPLFPEINEWSKHKIKRDKVAPLEKALACALKSAGYDVMNTVHCKRELDLGLWERVSEAFTEHFPNLGQGHQ